MSSRNGDKARFGRLRKQKIARRVKTRELKEELGATLGKCLPIGRVVHKYAETPEELEILFFAAAISEGDLTPRTFEKVEWVLPKELGNYDFLAANARLVAHLATGKIKPGELLEEAQQ